MTKKYVALSKFSTHQVWHSSDASNSAPSTFDYCVEGKNPEKYVVEPTKPQVDIEGEASKVDFSIVHKPWST